MKAGREEAPPIGQVSCTGVWPLKFYPLALLKYARRYAGICKSTLVGMFAAICRQSECFFHPTSIRACTSLWDCSVLILPTLC
ncbi:Small ribosomal subunit protein [Trichinella pseudospiralis]